MPYPLSVDSGAAILDGAPIGAVPESLLTVYSGGGPPLASGVPSQRTIDRAKSLQGSGTSSGAITATSVGDMSLTFSGAPVTIMPGQWILLQGSGTEYVLVALSYVPSASATTIPLASPVTGANHSLATWDVFAPYGPAGAPLLPTGVQVVAPIMQDSNGAGGTYLLGNATGDGNNTGKFLAISSVLYNGSQADRQRNNLDNISLITASGVTTTQTGADQTNYNGTKAIFVFDMTSVGTGSVTLTIQGKDPNSGKYFTLLAGAAVITNSTNIYYVFLGAAETANVSTNKFLPRTWRVITTANNANATTYKIGVLLNV